VRHGAESSTREGVTGLDWTPRVSPRDPGSRPFHSPWTPGRLGSKPIISFPAATTRWHSGGRRRSRRGRHVWPRGAAPRGRSRGPGRRSSPAPPLSAARPMRGSPVLDVGEQERDRAGRQRCRGVHRFALRDHVGQAEGDSLGAPAIGAASVPMPSGRRPVLSERETPTSRLLVVLPARPLEGRRRP